MKENTELVKKVVERLKEKTGKKAVNMVFCSGKPGITNSKLGGVPFIPDGGKYPEDKKTGEKLYLLLQLNFAEMPHIPNYPTEGIIQVFVSPDDLYGLDFDNRQSQEQWRIIYHEDISNPMPADKVEKLMPDLTEKDCMLPLQHLNKEYEVKFKEITMPISTEDFGFSEAIQTYCEDILTEEFRDLDWYDYPEEIVDSLYEELNGSGNRLGGYPYFTQEDPREYDDIPRNCELFLQIDSDGDDGEDGEWIIMWGDAGIGNFFIDLEDLQKRDFSKVYYNWDCC